MVWPVTHIVSILKLIMHSVRRILRNFDVSQQNRASVSQLESLPDDVPYSVESTTCHLDVFLTLGFFRLVSISKHLVISKCKGCIAVRVSQVGNESFHIHRHNDLVFCCSLVVWKNFKISS